MKIIKNNKILITLSLGLAILGSQAIFSAAGPTKAPSAGILPFIKKGGTWYVIMGVRPQKGVIILSDFGGKTDKGEKPQQTAFREFNEETNRIFRNDKLVYMDEQPASYHPTYFYSLPSSVNIKQKLQELNADPNHELRGYVSVKLNDLIKTIKRSPNRNVVVHGWNGNYTGRYQVWPRCVRDILRPALPKLSRINAR